MPDKTPDDNLRTPLSTLREPLALRELTSARVALPTTGHSIATSEVLRFQLAHAQARDAVHTPLNWQSLAQRLVVELRAPVPVLQLHSNAPTRADYLRRPDLGRALAAESAAQLQQEATQQAECGLAIVIGDGLSAQAVESNVLPLLVELLPGLIEAGWRLAPLVLVAQARVAVADEVGLRLGARCTLVLLGERPGLSAADSLGAYITWAPGPQRTDADRNCLSNIRSGGLPPSEAAARLLWYLDAARRHQLTGTALKDGSQPLPLA